jgi:hypothetical protein
MPYVPRAAGECPERQRELTVNQPPHGFVGSSPTSPTIAGRRCPRVLPVISELVSACMPQHVRVRRKRKPRALPYTPEQLAQARSRHRSQPLRHEHVARFRLLAHEPPQRANLHPTHRMHARRSILEPSHVQQPAPEVSLIPAKGAKFGRTQPMPVRDQHHRRVTVPMSAAPARGLHEQLHLLDSQVFAWPALCVHDPPGRYCPVYSYRHPPPFASFGFIFPCA